MTEAEVIDLIYGAIQRANELREPQDRLACAPETRLFGSGGGLDSLGLVSLVVDVEAAIAERTNMQLVLADDRALAEKHNPFRDVTSLAEYVRRRLEEARA